MIDLTQAIIIAKNEINQLAKYSKYEIILLLNNTIEFKYGWVFFYQTKIFVETGNPNYMLMGNAPIIINKFDSSCHITGTHKDIQEFIDEYISDREG